MSVLTTLIKWRRRWAALTGLFTLIILPILRLMFKPRTSRAKKTDAVIDVQAQEIRADLNQ